MISIPGIFRVMLALALILPVAMQAFTWNGSTIAIADPVALEQFYTRVYSLIGYRLPEGIIVSDARLAESLGLLVVAGVSRDAGPQVVGIDLNTKTVLWSQALVGNPLFVKTDSSSGEWAAIATDLGEVAVINLANPSVRADFYTASRAPVESMSIINVGGEPRVVVVDIEGAAYVSNPGKPGWIEFSPGGGGGVLKGYRAPPAALVVQDEILGQDRSWQIGARSYIILNAVQTGFSVNASKDFFYEDLDARVTAALYYEDSPGIVLPAIPDVIEEPDRNLKTVYTLYATVAPVKGEGVVLTPSWAHLQGTANAVDEATGLAILESQEVDLQVPAGDLKMVFIYTIEVYRVEDDGTEKLIGFRCFSSQQTIDPAPGSILDLDIVIMRENTGVNSIWDCASSIGITLGLKTLQPIIVVDVSSDQWSFDYQRDARIYWIPLPEDLQGGLSEATIVRLVSLSGNPGLQGLSSILLVGSPAGYLHIYYLDSDGYLLEGLPAPQSFYLGGSPVSSAVDPDGARVYVGTDRGHVFMIEFSQDLGLYWMSRSLAVSGSPVISLASVETGVMASAMDGVVQMIDATSWTPLWRNLPGFTGIDTGLENLVIVSTGLNPAVMVSPGESSFYTFNPLGVDLNPVVIDFGVTLDKGDGPLIVAPEDLGVDGYSTAAIRGPDGEVYAVDQDVWRSGRILFYTPQGVYQLGVEVDGIGSLSVEISVSSPITRDSLFVALREVTIRVVVPQEPPDPEYYVAYKLFSGPVEGVSIALTPSSWQGLSYEPQPVSVNAVTGAGGEAKVVIWEGVEYAVSGYSTIVESLAGVVPPSARGVVGVEASLKLESLVVKALDSQAFDYGVEYELRVSALSISSQVTGRSVYIEVDSYSPQVHLPPGPYSITVESRGYEDVELDIEIPSGVGVVQERVLMNPSGWEVTVRPQVVDPTGLVSGYLLNATVSLELVEPGIEYVAVDNTGSEGKAVFNVRTGVYRILVEHPGLGQVDAGLVEVFDNRVVVVPFPLEASSLSVELFDQELAEPAIGSFSVELTYVYTGYTVVFRTQEPRMSLDLPGGLYKVRITSIEGYYEEYQNPGLEIVGGKEHSARLFLEPVTIAVEIEAYYNDSYGIAAGGVGDALVTITPVETPFNVGIETTVTGSDGIARVSLRPGVYEVEVRHNTVESASTTVNLLGVDRDVVRVRIAMKPLYSTLELKAIDAYINVTLPDVYFRVVWLGYTTTTERVIESEGDASLVLPRGNYIVEAFLPGYYVPARQQISLLQERSSLSFELEPVMVELSVVVGYTPTVLVIGALQKPLPPTPAPGATVVLTPYDPLLEAIGVEPSTTVAGDDGVARVIVRAGVYTVEAVSGNSRDVQEVVIAEGISEIIISLNPTLYNVVLQAVDPDIEGDARYVGQAVAYITSYNGVRLDEPIEFTLPATAVLPQGYYTVVVKAEGYRDAERVITVDSPGRVDVALEPVRTPVEINVVADVIEEEKPVLWGNLVLRGLDIEGMKPLTLEIDDGYARAELRPGSYAVTVIVQIGESQIELDGGVVSIPQEGGAIKVVVLPELYAVSITALDKEFSAPLPRYTVSYSYQGPFGVSEGRVTAVRGAVAINLPPGVVNFTVEGEGYSPAVIDAVVLGETELEASLDPVLFTITLNILDPDGRPVEDILKIVLKHEELPFTIEEEVEGPLVRLRGVRAGGYIVTVTPMERADIVETTSRIVVSPVGGVSPGEIVMDYVTFLVNIRIIDSSTGDPVQVPFNVVIERLPPEGGLELSVEVEIIGDATVPLPPGNYRATLNPVGESYYRVDAPFHFTVSRDGTIELRISPILYTVSIVVVDDRGATLAGAFVRVLDSSGRSVAAGTTDTSGTFAFQAPFGIYVVEVEKGGYKPDSITVNVPQVTLVTVDLEPGPQVLARRYGPLAVGLVGLVLIAGVLYRIRDRIAKRMLEEEEYF